MKRNKRYQTKQKSQPLTGAIRRFLKPITAFLVVVMLSSTFGPSVAYALTSGPTAPEYTSFEPVDTTDMVNLATGDFVYNMPLLEVPGPAGGYPISLSYHAGIQPNEEASWVGLGWTLNPGAITRTVNGYPDDQYNATESRRDYVQGGETTTWSLGVGYAGASFGISVSNDTYQGFGVGSSIAVNPAGSLGSSSTEGSSSTVGIYTTLSMSTDGYGNFNSGFGAGFSIGHSQSETQRLVSKLGVSTDGNSTSLDMGVSSVQNGEPSRSLVGASLATKGLKPSFTVAGIGANLHNSKSQNWTINRMNLSAAIPLKNGMMITLGYKYVRYYIDEKSEVKVIGALHSEEMYGKDFDDWSYDSYALKQPGVSVLQGPESSIGGSFPAYDQYNVNAQGLSGSIRPFHFKVGHLMRQNTKVFNDDDEFTHYAVEYHETGSQLEKPSFRFLNDFSNAFAYDEDMYLDQDFEIVNGSSISDDSDGWDVESKTLAGSKHVATFTNQEIADGSAKMEGLLLSNDSDIESDRNRVMFFNDIKLSCDFGNVCDPSNMCYYDVSNQIGAFKVTNESGVTYHYSLPVYAYYEYQRNQKQDEAGGDVYTSYTQEAPYAYTWLLTAITGPDYVDRGGESSNANGVPDNDDWGYWVKFDYGKWSGNYKWRSPIEGFHQDIEADLETHSRGIKQLYYLNSIETASHFAVFEKEMRADAKSVSSIENGGFAPSVSVRDEHGAEAYAFSASSLKLNNIYLLEKTDLLSLSAISDYGQHQFIYLFDVAGWDLECDYVKYISDVHNGHNVIDVGDLNEIKEDGQTYRSFLESNAIRVISFDHSYDLQIGGSGVPNSFNGASMYVKDADTDFSYSNLGKLTLNQVRVRGKSGIHLTPPTVFSYDKNPEYNRDAFDIWNHYKSDFDQDVFENNVMVGRVTTQESSLDVDAWSLSGIRTSTGADILIEYESDSYNKPVLYNNYAFPVESISDGALTFSGSFDLRDFFEVGDIISFLYLQRYFTNTGCSDDDCPKVGFDSEPQKSELTITNVSENSINATGNIPNYSCPTTFGDLENAGGFCNQFWAGSISQQENREHYGGGVRVKSLGVRTLSGRSTKTRYSYIDENGKTTGYTSFEPFGLIKPTYPRDSEWTFVPSYIKTDYENLFYGNFSALMQVSREVPAPGVVYETVTVTEEVDESAIPGKVEYNFQVFESSFISKTTNSGSGGTWPVTFRDYSARVGNLRSIKTYGADQLLMEKTTEYFWEKTENYKNELSSKFRNQGVVQEAFTEYRTAEVDDDFVDFKVFSRREIYPSIILGTKTINYKTGITTESRNLAFDFFTGEPSITYSQDGYGNKYLSQNTPAYHYYDAMDLALNGGKHMLTQEGTSYSYRLSDDFDPNAFVYSDVENLEDNDDLEGFIGASAQSWSKDVPVMQNATKYDNPSTQIQDNIYRKHESFSFVGVGDETINADGTMQASEFSEVPLGSPIDLSESAGWQKNAEITLYDINSHALEATDVNGNYAATRFDVNNERIIATVANAEYGEFTHASFGSMLDGDIEISSNYGISSSGHTGNGVSLLQNGRLHFDVQRVNDDEQSYRVSFWAKPTTSEQTVFYYLKAFYNVGEGDVLISGFDEGFPKAAGATGWKLYQATVHIPSGTSSFSMGCKGTSSSGTALATIDDFRVHPVDATMTGYVYNEWGELSDILDANNLYTHYEYDDMGRLKSVTRETLSHGPVKVSETTITYKNN